MFKSFYAIKIGKGVENIVVESWEECRDYVLGYNSVYKGFRTQKDANRWIKSLTDDKVNEMLKRQYEMKLLREKKEKGFKEIEQKIEEKYIDNNLSNFIQSLIKKGKITFGYYGISNPLELVQVCYNSHKDCVELSFRNNLKEYIDELEMLTKEIDKRIDTLNNINKE